MHILNYPLKELKNIKPVTVAGLHKKNLLTVRDLIEYFPRRYEDRSNLLDIHSALWKSQKDPTFITTLIARCEIKEKTFFRNRQINTFGFSDQSGSFKVPAFNPYLRFQVGQYYMLSGKTKKRGRAINLYVNEYEIFDEEAMENLNLGRIVPIYGGGENLSQKILRHLIYELLSTLKDHELKYNLPPHLIKDHKFPAKKECFLKVHFPEQQSDIRIHRYPFIYEEFYHLQKSMAEKKQSQIENKELSRYRDTADIDTFIKELPYELTPDQYTTWNEIKTDLLSGKVMHRMLQGDVGTGKTLVALISMMFVYLNGHQAALMAPTEILATQHYQTFAKLLGDYARKTKDANYQIKLVLLTGGISSKAQEVSRWDIAEESELLIIGTHSLIQKNLKFKNLKYVVIDEQHRFGVEQREALIQKGKVVNKKSNETTYPDLCTMSATPIPRSLFVSYFGDMEVSLLKTKPSEATEAIAISQTQSNLKANSSKTNTQLTKPKRACRVLFEYERNHGYRFLLHRIRKGEQGYVVFPVIEESSQKNLRSLMKEYELLKKKVFDDIPVGLIHGKMPAEEKQILMDEFRQRKLLVLFATTVLEVGIDHPNATTIIIESAQQFGLSQLHQLRGRIGRGEKSGYCYLVVKDDVPTETLSRLEEFSKLEDGFKIAELDLQIRGPGDLLGVKQSGIPPLKMGNLVKDYDILLKARRDVYQEYFPQEELPVYFTEGNSTENKK